MKNKRVLIACRIFEEEIDHILNQEQDSLEVSVLWVDAGLHANLELLEKELASAIDRAKALEQGEVRVLFGRGCLPQIQDLTDGKGVDVSSVQNCLSAFLGEEGVRELEQNRTMLMTPTWVRAWPDNMRRISGWSEVDFRTNLGRYERILVLDSGINPLNDDEILEFFDLVQVPVEFEVLNLDHFRRTLHAILE